MAGEHHGPGADAVGEPARPAPAHVCGLPVRGDRDGIGEGSDLDRPAGLVRGGPAQNGMETLQGFFSGAVPNQTISTPSGAELYANQCSATALTSTATDVWLCAVRSGSNTAYSYEIHFPSSTCTPNGICTLQIDQQGSAQPVAQIDNVCAHCANATNTSFGFTPTPADLSVIPLVAITLTIAAPPTNGNANPSTTTTVVRQVMLSNSLGGLL